MKSLILDLATQWAGDRIICIGDYVRRGDLPENLLSKEEEEMLDSDHDEDSQSYYDCLVTHCDINVSGSPYQPDSLLLRLVRCVPWQHQRKLLTDISIGYRKPEILRNISKRQYMRRSALLGMVETCPEHWGWDRVDLGHVILSRISWSSDSSVSMSYDGDIHRGVWAGDRFDITSADALDEKDENGQAVEWTDVTDEVLEEMFKIWLSEYGEGTFKFMSTASCIADVHFPTEQN